MTDITTTQSSVRAFIMNEFFPGEDQSELTNDAELVTSGLLDSLATLKLVTYLEEEFGVVLEPNEVTPENLNSIDLITSLVDSKR